MREFTIHNVDRIEARILPGPLVQMLELIFVERAGDVETDTPVCILFNDSPDALIEDLVEGINNIVSLHRRKPTAAVLPFTRKEPA